MMVLAGASARLGQMAQDFAGAGKYPMLGPFLHSSWKTRATSDVFP
jgi:hypothetical protein